MLVASACSDGTARGGLVDPIPTGTITLSLSPSGVALAAGSTGSVGLTVTRSGFDGPVTLSASGVPAGMSLTFGSSTVAPGASSTSVNLTVTTAIPAPSVEISIVGTGGGLMSPAAKLTLRPL